jgi:hypothetical protein
MTVMQSSETRFNLILSIGLTVIGLLLWGFGLQAVARNTLLPDYAAALRGCAGVLVLLGLLWLALAAIRSLESLSNLAASFLLSFGALVLWLFAKWLVSKAPSSGYALPLLDGGRNALVVCLAWLVASVGKLIVTTPAKKTR